MPAVPAFAPDRAIDRAAAEAFAAASLPSTDEEVWRYSRIDHLDLARYAPVGAEAPRRHAIYPTPAPAVLDLAARPGLRRGRHRRRPGGAPALPRWARADGSASPPTPATTPAHAPHRRRRRRLRHPQRRVRHARRSPHRSPAAVVAPVVVVHWVSGAGVAAFPRHGARCRRRQRGRGARGARLGRWRRRPRRPRHPPARSARPPGSGTSLIQDLGQHLAARPTSTPPSTPTPPSPPPPPASAAPTPASAPTAASSAAAPPATCGPSGSARPTRPSTSAPSRSTPPPTPPATSSTRAPSPVAAAASTPGSSGSTRSARGTDARQTNRNLKLSDDAWAESVPNLEIRNNDVRCTHASAVGPVDEEQRWYLESRGVPTGRRRAAHRAGLLRGGRRPTCPSRRPAGPCGPPSTASSTAAASARWAAGVVTRRTTVDIGALDDFADGEARRVELDGRRGRSPSSRLDDDLYAIGDRCTHQDISLSEGEVDRDERTLECWKHGSAFSLATGEPTSLARRAAGRRPSPSPSSTGVCCCTSSRRRGRGGGGVA